MVYGPALLPTGPGNKWAFALFQGTCSALRERLQRGERPGLENLTDDELIKAAELPPPER